MKQRAGNAFQSLLRLCSRGQAMVEHFCSFDCRAEVFQCSQGSDDLLGYEQKIEPQLQLPTQFADSTGYFYAC